MLWAEVRNKIQPVVPRAVENNIGTGLVVRGSFKGAENMVLEKYLVRSDSGSRYVLWYFKRLGIVVKAKLVDHDSDEHYPENALKTISREQFENIIRNFEVKKL